MQIKDMTSDELKSLIRETVVETLEEYLGDPDEGKEIKEEVKQQLLESLKRTQAGERGVPLAEVVKSVNEELKIITVHKIGHRREIYG